MDNVVRLDVCDETTEFATYSVYDGRELKGVYVVLDAGEFQAFDHTDKLLGTFSKAKDACQAIAAAWEGIP